MLQLKDEARSTQTSRNIDGMKKLQLKTPYYSKATFTTLYSSYFDESASAFNKYVLKIL